MTTYAKMTSYGYSRLYKQLELVNYVIGNSVSDYEEQKVLRKYHRTNINSFSYIFARKDENNSDFIDTYKIQHFINMGLIPVFLMNMMIWLNVYLKLNDGQIFTVKV